MQVIQRRVTMFGTNDEREAFNLAGSDPSQVTGTFFHWITPEGNEWESVGSTWVQTVRAGAGRNFPLFASGAYQADDGHTRIHSGQMFRADYVAASVNNDASIDLVITTAENDYPHIIFHPSLDGSADLSFYEGTVFTGGTAVASFNHKRTSTRTYAGALVHSPSISNVGTLLMSSHMSGGTGPHASGGMNGYDDEWILKPQTSYLIRLTNRAGQSRRAGLSPTWYIAPLLADM